MAQPTSGIIRLDRRQQLLRAAADLFSERGYATTSIDSIGAQAGITGPAVYRHFSGKRDLLITLLTEAVDSALGDIARAMRPDAAALAKLEALVAQVVRHAITDRQVIGLLYANHGTLAAVDRETVQTLRGRVMGTWLRALREARPEMPEADAELVVAAALAVVSAITRSHAYSEGLYTRMMMGLLTA